MNGDRSGSFGFAVDTEGNHARDGFGAYIVIIGGVMKGILICSVGL